MKPTPVRFSLLALLVSTCIAMPASADRASKYSAHVLTVDEVKSFFDTGAAGLIGEAEMRRLFLRITGNPEDAYLASHHWLQDDEGFFRDQGGRQRLLDSGLWVPGVTTALSAADYLAYLDAVFGSRTVAALRAQLYLSQNHIYNIRTYGVTPGDDLCVSAVEHLFCDIQWRNRIGLHRENRANELAFDHIAAAAGVGPRDPLRERYLTCAQLEHVLGAEPRDPWVVLRDFVANDLNLAPPLARAVANQYAGPPALRPGNPGRQDRYGMRAFVRGQVACTAGACKSEGSGLFYEADEVMAARMPWLPTVVPPGRMVNTDCAALVDLVHAIAGHDGYTRVGRDIEPNPRSAGAPPAGYVDVTAFELREVLIGFGNALINRPNAPFIDILPPDDLRALDAALLKCADRPCPGKPLTGNSEMDYQEAVFAYIDRTFLP